MQLSDLGDKRTELHLRLTYQQQFKAEQVPHLSLPGLFPSSILRTQLCARLHPKLVLTCRLRSAVSNILKYKDCRFGPRSKRTPPQYKDTSW